MKERPDTATLSRRDALFGLAEGAALLGVGVGLVSSAANAQSVGVPPASSAVTPFRVAIPQMAIDELKLRLQMTRLPSTLR